MRERKFCRVCIGPLPCKYSHDQRTPDESRRERDQDEREKERETTMYQSDFSMLPEDAKTHPAYLYFQLMMKGRQYGREPLNDAWTWFRIGWENCDKNEVGEAEG